MNASILPGIDGLMSNPRRLNIWHKAMLVAITITCAGVGAHAEERLTGTWQGNWNSIEGDVGQVTLEIVQRGNQLSGNMSLTATDCGNVSGISLSGTFVGANTVAFDAEHTCSLDGSFNELEFTQGAVTTNQISGSYVLISDGELWDQGSFEVARARNIVSSTATSGGTISPAGSWSYLAGTTATYTIQANDGFEIADVLVDGQSVGQVSQYNFTSISTNHFIHAQFSEESEPPPPPPPPPPGGDLTPEQIVLLIQLLGSEDPAESGGPGSVRVVSETTGQDLDPTGYVATVTIGGGLASSTQLNINGFVNFNQVATGSQQVEVSDIASNCSAPNNPRVIDVQSGLNEAVFNVHCILRRPTGLSGAFAGSQITLNWQENSASETGYELQVSSSPMFANVEFSFQYAANTNSASLDLDASEFGQTWYFRVRATGTQEPSPFSNTAAVDVPAATQITIVNNMSNSLNINNVVQFKVVPVGQFFSNSDYLTDDPAECLVLPGDRVSPGNQRTFNITAGQDYFVFIGIGVWDLSQFCPNSAPWFKRRFFTTPQFETFYVWQEVSVTGHVSGNWTWTIAGSYLNGSLVVTPTGSSPIAFNVTANSPL